MTSEKSDEDCIFCRAARSGPSLETLTLATTDDSVVMMNRYPYTNGHVMIAPVAHESRLYETSDGRLSELIRLTAHVQRLLSDEYRCDGFNIGMNFGEAAGAGVADHYHIHVVPRWNGDSNFMGVTASTRIVPEDLEVTWNKLRKRLEGLGA